MAVVSVVVLVEIVLEMGWKPQRYVLTQGRGH